MFFDRLGCGIGTFVDMALSCLLSKYFKIFSGIYVGIGIFVDMKYMVVYVQIDVTTALGMWAPVIAEYIKENIYRLTDKEPVNAKDFDNWRKKTEQSAYDPELEEWEFPPGTMVRCEWFTGERGDVHLRAVETTEL